MPIYDIDTRVKLREMGIDPDRAKFLDEEQPQNPSTNPTPSVLAKPPTTTTAGAFGRSAARSFIPAGAGAAAAIGLGSVLDATGVGAPIGIPLQIGGALLGSYAAKKAQDAIANQVSPTYQQSEQTDVTEHPVASTLGGLTAQLPFFTPGIKPLVGAGRAIRDIASYPIMGARPAAADLGNLLNVGLGASIPTGMAVAEGERDPKQIVLQALGGALLNKPGVLAKAMGAQPNVYREYPTEGIKQAHAESGPVEGASFNMPRGVPPNERLLTEGEKPTKSLTDISEQLKSAEPTPQAVEQAKLAEQQAKLEENKLKLARIQTESQNAHIEAQIKEMQKNPPVLVQPEVVPVKPLKGVDYTKGQQKQIAENEAAPKTEAEDIQEQYDLGKRYSEGPNLKDLTEERQKPIVEGLKSSGVSSVPSQGYADKLQNLAKFRGVEMADAKVTNREGEEISGQASNRTETQPAKAYINPAKEGLDTRPHEIFHPFYNDLETVGNAEEKALVERASKAIESNETYQKWKSAREAAGMQSSPEEYLTTHVGEDEVRRLLGTDKKGDFKNWLTDFYTSAKEKLGNATPEDYARIFSRKLAYEPSFDEMFGKGGVRIPAVLKDEIDKSEGESLSNKEQPALKEAPVEYAGEQQGFGPIPGTHIYNLKEDISDTYKKGSTVSQRLLREHGFKIPEGMKGDSEELLTQKINKWAELKKNQQMSQGESLPTREEPDRSRLIPGVKNTSAAMSEPLINFDRGGMGRIQEYRDWLVQVKGMSSEAANQVVGEIENSRANHGEPNASNNPTRLEKESTNLSEQSLPRYSEDENIPPSESPAKGDTIPAERTPREISLGKFKPEIDKVRALKTPNAEIAADGLEGFYQKLTRLRGRYVNKFARNLREVNPVRGLGDYVKQNTDVADNVREYLDQKQDGKVPTKKLSGEEENTLKAVRDILKQTRIDQNSREGLRKGKFNEDYLPMVPDRKVIDTLQQNPESPEALKLKGDFEKYQREKMLQKNPEASVEDINKQVASNWENFINGWTKQTVDIASQFGPIDKPEGYGIPESWREKNLQDRMTRYLERVARRFAYYDAIESKPEVQKGLGVYKGHESVKTIMNDIAGVQPTSELFRSSVGGIVRAAMLGPLTGAKDFVSNLTLGFQHAQNPAQAVQSALHAWGTMKENIADSFDMGVNRVNLNTLEWSNGMDDVISGLRRTRDIISEVQGRNWLEQMTRATAFGQGRFLALDFAAQKAKGNLSKAGESFFKDMGKGLEIPKNGKLTPETVKELAARYVESVQGTYDYRGLPQIAVEGSWSPVLALARWNIEKANNFNKFVVNPLLNGNPRPMLMSTLGMF
jgi:hypothetical protein